MAVDDIGRGSDLQINGQVQPAARPDGSFPGASSVPVDLWAETSLREKFKRKTWEVEMGGRVNALNEIYNK